MDVVNTYIDEFYSFEVYLNKSATCDADKIIIGP